MELEKVKEIYETSSYDTANFYLSWGWILLSVAKMNTDSREWSSPIIKYSLGWLREEEPKHKA
ncbi:MAG: hypothetical protein ABFD50_23390 [Smithella sp.]